ncbi:Fe-S cluster assembly protein SufD [Corynebacterium poyangense]|uniref:Fe-S cluster assembly protein SufD n=1 Tax=Corynebacterium poyangense TaxID=2684405 RepID=A0A7H0SNY7_9CORY|nr:Fe-S cluster assembly protein SufD [Corynebacterium poyangense]QNQ90262.1 Fe-S cluster assembly protein SufD [Corynebacterium poyangense]
MAETATTVSSGTPHNNKGDLFTSFNVEDFDVPKGRDEVWRFIPLRRLRGLHNGSFSSPVEQNFSVEVPAGAEQQVTVERIARDDARVGRTGGAVDRVGAQVWSTAPKADYLLVHRDAVIKEPIRVTIQGTGADNTSFGISVLELASGAEAVIDLRYRGSGTHADNIEIILGDNARLTLITDLDWDNDALHLNSQVAVLGRDSVLRHNVGIFGGEVVRVVPRVKFTAPGADAELTGVYFADDGQYFEQRLLVDHSVPNCRSNVLYKGALQGDPESALPDARNAWVGDVLIRANAQGTDTYEVNRNLVLTEGARADAVPNLEIETGEIAGAGHAATVGRFDDEHLFYLMARGIPENIARRLIVRGFFSEVINRIAVDDIREDFENRIAAELEGVSL